MDKKHFSMKTSEILREQIIDIVEKQISNNDPPETSLTFKRLISLGYEESDVKMLIGQCVSIEIFNVLKHGNTFDQERYVKNLNKLPKEPFE